ncbi:MAG: tetratricopeptide repeat protein [Bacteroidetes bacterium]|nr:tetratricopeptide repeat protein [Bacteroidota bacterium]
MLINVFLIIVIFLSLFVLLNILINKFAILKKIKIERITKEKEKKIKLKILEKRFLEAARRFPLFKKILNFISFHSNKIISKFRDLENKYKDKISKIIKESPVETEKEIEKLIKDGDDFLNENNLKLAEDKFKKILTFDPRNLKALKNLSKIYSLENKLKEAKNINEDIVKINKQTIKWWLKFNKNSKKIPETLIQELVLSLINLGDIFNQLGQKEKAISYFKSALSRNPNNPRILDFLIENYILSKEKERAINCLIKIKEINQNNQKIAEWDEKIKNLSEEEPT